MPALAFVTVRAQDHPVLLPQPQQIKYGNNQVKIADLTIYLPAKSAPEDVFNANELAGFLKSRTGITVPVINEKKGKQVQLSHGNLPSLPGLDETSGPKCREAYTMKIDKNGIIIKGNSSAGAYYAIQTLRQMTEGSGINSFFPEAEISDYPALPYRGLLVPMGEGANYNEQFAREIIVSSRGLPASFRIPEFLLIEFINSSACLFAFSVLSIVLISASTA